MIIPQGIDQVRRALPRIEEDRENGLTDVFRNLLEDLRQDLARLDGRIKMLDQEIERVARTNEAAKRLQTIPGIGPITATARVADLGEARQFKRGREVSAFLGLTPRQHSSGGKERLSGISKRGDAYLRTLLIHGARAALRTAKKKTDPRSRGVIRVSERRHRNIAAVALANKNARIAWAVLNRGGTFDPEHGQRFAESPGHVRSGQ
jgi:transposase